MKIGPWGPRGNGEETSLPLVLARGLVEDVFLAINSEHAVLENALPTKCVSNAMGYKTQ